jgi:hypothetical protein
MKQEHIDKALRKYPMPWIIFVDNPSCEWKLQRLVNIAKYIKELQLIDMNKELSNDFEVRYAKRLEEAFK